MIPRSTNRRARQTAAALLAAACLGAATPAFATDATNPPGSDATTLAPAPSPAPSTTRASEAPRPTEPPRPSTTPAPKPAESTAPTAPKPAAPKPAGTKVTAMLDELAKVVKNSKLDEATKSSLLGRIAQARAAVESGTVPENAVMQALINDVRTAVGAGKGGDSKPKPAGDSTVPSAPKSSEAPDAPEAGKGPDKAGVLRLLDYAATKVSASMLDDTAKQALLGKIADLRAKVDTGAPLGHEELGQLIAEIRAAVGAAGGENGKGDKHAEDEGKKPGDRALAEIDRQIVKVTNSDLPADVKAKILAALEEAKAKIAAGAAAGTADDGTAARAAIEEHRKEKVDALVARLTKVADKLDAKVAALAAAGGNDALVADARAKLVQARDLLTLSATPQDLRTAWGLLREVRRAIGAVEHPATTTTSIAAPAPAPAESTPPPSDSTPDTTA